VAPQKFLRETLRYDSDQSVAAAHATPGAVSSSSERGHVCISAMVNRCQRHTGHHHSADSDLLAELQWMTVPKLSDQMRTAEEAAR